MRGGAKAIDVDGKGRTAAHMACWAGNFSALLPLIDAGGNKVTEITDDEGRSLVHYAAAAGDIRCLTACLDAGASAAEPLDKARGASPLYEAIYLPEATRPNTAASHREGLSVSRTGEVGPGRI